MYTVPFFHRGDTEAPQRLQRPQRRKRDAFFQRGHRGRILFLLMNKTEELAKLFLDVIWKHHGLPDDIVLDRDSKFISHFCQSYMDLLSVKLNLSTTFLPQTDGQT